MQPADAKSRCTLPKSERLCSGNQISQMVAKRQYVFCYPFKCYYDYEESSLKPNRFAVCAPKRNFRHAVDRNRVKRMVREVYRLQKNKRLTKWTAAIQRSYSLFFYCVGKSLDDYQFDILEKKMEVILSKLRAESHR